MCITVCFLALFVLLERNFIKLLCRIILLPGIQKQLSGGVLKKKCSENMQQIYRRTPMPKCDFNKVACFATLLKSHFGVAVLL